MTLLGGYPLPLTVVLPVLAAAKPSAVLAELQAGGQAADPAGLIRRAVEYSHGKLDPALQASLQLLAPFTAVIPTGPILRDLPGPPAARTTPSRALGPVDLAAALDQAVAVGLAAPHPELSYLVQVQPVLPWFLRSRLHDQPALQAATSQAHYQHYAQLAGQFHGMLMSRDNPQQRATGQAAARAEYANLTTALAHGLRTGQPITSLILALDEYLDQAQQHDTRRQLLDTALAAYPEPASQAQQRELAVLRNLAGAHRADPAPPGRRRRPTTRLSSSCSRPPATAEAQGATYHQLGMVAQEQRRFAEAEASYRQALDIFLEFGDRHRAARTYHQLGMVAQEQRRFAEAEASYRQALDIKLEFGDRHSAAATYHQLGMVAQEQRRFAEAEASYRQALDIYLEFGDRHSAAATYHQLGMVAQEQRRFAEAEASYRQALDIYLEFGDRHGAAATYHQLGRVAQEQRRFAEAEASYRQALDIKLEFGDRHSAAVTYHQLGMVAQEQRRFAEAEASYRQALDIYLEFGDRHSAAATYHQLGRVAQEQRRFAEAEASYRQALDIYLEFGDRHSAAPPTTSSAWSRRSSGGSPRPRPATARPSTSAGNPTPVRPRAQPACSASPSPRLGRHHEAVRTLLYAAVTWHQQTGQWDSRTSPGCTASAP